jgi:hypothetical protein
MSNEFDRYTSVPATLRLLKFVAGLRLQARAADSVDHTDGIAWRASLAAGSRARRLRGVNK